MPLDDILEHDRIEDAGKISPDLFVAVGKIVEFQKLGIGERMDAHLHMSSGNQGGQLAGKHLGIAAGNDDIRVIL